jgi:hypothetical protein
MAVFSAQLRRSSLTHACTSMGTCREPPCAQTSSESIFAHPHLRSRRTAVVLLLIELHRRAKPPIMTAFISHFKSQHSCRHHISPPPSAALPSCRSNSPHLQFHSSRRQPNFSAIITIQENHNQLRARAQLTSHQRHRCFKPVLSVNPLQHLLHVKPRSRSIPN